MGTSAIAHLKYDLDKYVVDLKRIATLASTFFIENYHIRREYLREIDEYINDINRRFRSTFDVNERMRLIAEIVAERDLAHREYQILRQGSYTKYIATEIFEDQGVIKYAKITGGVIAGGVQAFGGWSLLQAGRRVHLRKLNAIGLTLMAHGTNNAYEAITPLLYEHQDIGPIRYLYRLISKQLGYDKYHGDFAYSTVDFSITAYSAYKGLVLKENPSRLVSKRLFETPGTGRLFRYTTRDYITKWESKNTTMRIFQIGSSINKLKATFYDEKYKYHEGE